MLEDRDLGDALPGSRRERIASSCEVAELRLPAGRWSGRDPAIQEELGLLMLDGILIRRVAVAGRFGAELLGRGDLLMPWHDDDGALTLPLSTVWLVHEPARLAVLDEGFTRLIGRYPRLGSRIVARGVRRSRYLAVNMAIVRHARVDVRLQMLLWHLAGRFGRVRADGVIVPLRLTHALLAELVAARRQTVTSALSSLAREGRVRPMGNAWLLVGEAPAELGRAVSGSIGGSSHMQ